MVESAVFEGKDLSVAYGGVRAVTDVNLVVRKGQVVGLIGPNGAGKTSFIDGVSGFARMTGSVQLNGSELAQLRAHRRSALGLSRTWQSVGLFEDLTVQENVSIALKGRRCLSRFRRNEPDLVIPVLQKLGIENLAELLPGEISHGQRVLVGVARAIVGSPTMVLMDEPGAGLDDAEGAQLGRFIRRLADAGTAVLLVDHDMNLVLDVCDHIYVLDFGKLIASGTPREIAANPKVIAAYLGSSSGTTENDTVRDTQHG
jgi:branched-chain amino acid transport system ATP-binding protein